MTERERTRQDLRATSEAIEADALHLAAIEAEKQALDPADAEVSELSERAVDVATRVLREAHAERDLSRSVT